LNTPSRFGEKMYEVSLSPLELTVTYIHTDANEDKQKVHKWLDEIVAKGEYGLIPAIIAVHDPDNSSLYVYNGNKRTAHAAAHCYNLNARIIECQEDLNALAGEKEFCWFGISDFGELLEFMRIYSAYPGENQPMPDDLLSKVIMAQARSNLKREYALFGPDDD
jgi:hypothetical protein